MYYGGPIDGWIPCKWCFPSGMYRLDGKKSALDLSLGREWRNIK